MDVGPGRKEPGLERKLTAGSLNVTEQRTFRNLISMQLDKAICPLRHNQPSPGLILKLKALVSVCNGQCALGKGTILGIEVGHSKLCEFGQVTNPPVFQFPSPKNRGLRL